MEANPTIREVPLQQEKQGFPRWFANLEFQLGSDNASSVFPDIQSQTVSGSWIQFLPGFQDEKGNSLAFDRLQLNRVGDAGLSISPSLTLNTPDYHLAHYLLVTRDVHDITGRIREAYVGIAFRDTPKIWTMLLNARGVPIPLKSFLSLRARFLDIRAGDISRPANDVEFWTRILGNDLTAITDKTRATIVSVSPAIQEGACSA